MELTLHPYDFYIKEKKVMAMLFNGENKFIIQPFENVSVRYTNLNISYYNKYNKEQILLNQTFILNEINNTLDEILDIISYLFNDNVFFNVDSITVVELQKKCNLFLHDVSNDVFCTQFISSLKNKIFFFRLYSIDAITQNLGVSEIEKKVLFYFEEKFAFLQTLNTDKSFVFKKNDIINALYHFIDLFNIFFEYKNELNLFFNSLLSFETLNIGSVSSNLIRFLSQYEYLFFIDLLDHHILKNGLPFLLKHGNERLITEFPGIALLFSTNLMNAIFSNNSLFHIFSTFYSSFYVYIAIQMALVLKKTNDTTILSSFFIEHYDNCIFTFFDKKNSQFISMNDERLVDFSYIYNIVRSLKHGFHMPLRFTSSFIKTFNK